MEDLDLTLPHDVGRSPRPAVRDALRDAPGVGEVVASSLDKTVRVTPTRRHCRRCGARSADRRRLPSRRAF